MANFNEQIKAWYNEWQDNIRKEIDYIKMDNTTKVNEILALRNVIRENENKLYEIGILVRKFANNALNIAEETDNTRDYATYADMRDKIGISLRKFANNALNIAEEVDNAHDYAAYVVDRVGELMIYNPDEDEDDDEDEEEDDEPVAYCANCGTEIWDEDEIVDGYEGEYCCDDCREEAEGEEEPVAYCENCNRAIWDEKDIVEGDYGEYCCDECYEEAEGEDNALEGEVEAEE